MEPNVPPLEEDKTVYETLLQDGLIKKVTRVVPWFSKLQLIDVAFKVRSFKEDSFFAQSQFYRENLRRGLSFIHEENLGTFICRRGLQKFFDLRVEYFDVLDGTIPIDGAKIPKVEKALYNVIFDEVTRVLNEGGKVTVYKTEKANGENAQVSYNKKHDAWIVASKNVSMMLRNRADIEEYKRTGEEGKTEGRYSVAIMIAQAWFNILEKSGKGEELKKEMSNKTLVGEYCGHPDYQHLVTYKDITIFFFAMVDIHGKRSCHPMNETFAFLKKYDLPIVKIEARRECSNIKELIGVLHELTTEVAQSTIEEDAEGSVIYFEGNMDGRFEILSLCKVKTLEYRLYRKLREKLKTTIGKDKSIADVLAKYKSESEVLAKGYKTPKPLSHYQDVAALALNFVKDNIDKAKDLKLTHRYLDFLNVILACQKAGTLPSLAHFKTLLESADNFSESEEEEGGEGEENV